MDMSNNPDRNAILPRKTAILGRFRYRGIHALLHRTPAGIVLLEYRGQQI